MPYYSDVPYYYGGSYANHSSLMTGSGRPFTPLSRFSPHLSTISESPISHLHRFSPISMSRHPRRVIDTADIDVSTPRIFSHDVRRPRNRLRRDRPTIKIRSQALKDNPALREHNERHEKSIGELLMEKFLIKDKKSSGEEPHVRLYHQVSLDHDENFQERDALQKKITRRFTRRRSSADLQLDAEQLQREVTYAQVQAKVLDTLVAEEQAQIENEARRGTLIRKGTVRGSMSHSYYSSNAESDTMTQEEEEAAAQRMRKTMKKAKKKKKSTDKPSPPDHRGDNRRSSTSSEMSVDSKIDEEENDGPRPQMYKIEACNSAGDFSTIWVNASENEKHKMSVEQFRESVRVPIPRKLGTGNNAEPPSSKSSDESETRIVLPVRKPYVKDPSRNSVYLTMRKPSDKLDEKIDAIVKDDESELLANGLLDTSDEMLKNMSILKSDDSPKVNGEVQANDIVKDVKNASKPKKTTAKLKKTELSARKDVYSAPKSSDDEGSYGKRDTVISRAKNDAQKAASENAETVSASIQSDVSAFVSTNAQMKQPLKDIPVGFVKNVESRKDDNTTRKGSTTIDESVKVPMTKNPAIPKVDKHVDKEEERASDAPKIPTMSREDVTTRRSVVSIAGDTSENSTSVMPTPSTTYLPKVSKINADRNNAVEAPELSLREATYLANATKCERAEDVRAELPGKKVDKASCLANNNSSFTTDAEKEASGVGAGKSTLESARDNATKSKVREATLHETGSGEVRSNEREIMKPPAKDVALVKAPKSNVPRALSSDRIDLSTLLKSETADVSKETGLSKPPKLDAKKVDAVDLKKDLLQDSRQFSPKNKAPKISGTESKPPFNVKISSKTGADPPKVGKDSSVEGFKTTKNMDGKAAPSISGKDTPKLLKKSISVDSSKSTTTPISRISMNLQQSVSTDERVVDKNMPIAEPTKLATSKVAEKKKPLTLDVSREKPQEESGQLSKSASTESIDFWSEIKAPDSPQPPRLNKPGRAPFEITVTPKIEEKTKPTNLKWVSSDLPSGKSPTMPIKEIGADKKNESDVKVSVTPRSTAVGYGDVVEEKVVPESPKAKVVEATKPAKPAETEKSTLTVQKVPRKKKNLSIAIGGKDLNSTVKKAPLKREESAQSDSSSTAVTSTPASETPTPVSEVTVPVINIIEVPKLPGTERQSVDEESCEDVPTPTNEPADPSFIKISKWSKQDDLTSIEDGETPVPSEETSLAASPAASPQSSKTKRAAKKKKPSTKKQSSTKGEKEAKETKKGGNEVTTNNQPNVVKSPEKQLLATKPSPKTSPKFSPRNSPSKRPLDLIRMFYTTPSALLTATPRDLSKVRRAKIKRRKHHSRTPSVSSDSTGSTTSTATTESTDGSGSTCTELDDDAERKRMNSTRSNDSGFDGSPRISNCDMACHKKCEKLTGNLCGLNQKLVAEALQALKRAPSQSSDNQRNSDSSDHFPSGRITPPATNLPRFKKYAVTDFNFLKVLGKGSFGKVLLAELRGTECVYAVKCLKKDVVLEDDDVECTLIERKVLTLATRHPYLCHLFCTFQTDSHLFFVMEYLNGGDLMFHIQKSGRFAEVRARFYAAEIWSGLNFLHKKGIVYRDLKLDNVLLDFDGHIRIADFGMCKLQIFLDRTADTFCGTPDYMAPEIIKGLKYNQAVDWWSYGVLLYEMLTGQSPFSGCDEDELFWSICNERPFIPRYLSQEATDMLVCLLEKDSGKRPPGHEIAMHAFFQNLPWDRLERRQLEPPFKPALEHTLDTKYFDTAFTTERPRLTPVPEQILTSMDQGVFRGFSYTNPNATD